MSSPQPGGVNLVSSTSADASGKEVTSADFIKSDIQSNLLNYTTNRILEIPQDIKVEMNDNKQLVLKAGSKIWYPDGFEGDGVTPKFSSIITQDTITSLRYGEGRSGGVLVVYSFNKDHPIEWARAKDFFSGTTQPTNDWYIWYDTTENRIKLHYGTGNYDTNVTFPFCIATEDSPSASGLTDGGLKSIDQVFNGFGFIGSTIFALPGVKCLATDGLDELGHVKSAQYEIQNVLTRTLNKASYNTTCVLDCVNSTLTTRYNFVISDSPTSGLNGVCRYTPASNQYIYDEQTTHSSVALFDFKADDTGTVTSLTSHNCQPFVSGDALQFNASGRSLLSSLSMPSSKYIDLTLGASGTTYTAPANGWIYCSGRAVATPAYISIDIPYTFCGINGVINTDLTINQIAVKSGTVFALRYSNTTINYLRFVYAQGDQ